jgi:hypothetical protein
MEYNVFAEISHATTGRGVFNLAKSSGDITYCPYIGSARGVVISWSKGGLDGVLTDYDCEHTQCGKNCDMYKKRPIGITQQEAIKTRKS